MMSREIPRIEIEITKRNKVKTERGTLANNRFKKVIRETRLKSNFHINNLLNKI